MSDLREDTMDLLIEHVMYQLQEDFESGDTTAIDELLRFVPVENLINYLPEELHAKYQYLFKTA